MALTISNLPPALAAALRAALKQSTNDIDICVAGTGPLEPRSFMDLSPDDWTIQMNALRDACFAAQRVARNAIAANRLGRIVFVAHPPALRAVPGATTAAVAGAFLTTFAQVGGIEMAARNITCNVVIAGWTEESSPATLTHAIPVGRYATTEEIVDAITFLASARAAYITGAMLTVDGGFVISKAGGGSPFIRI